MFSFSVTDKHADELQVQQVCQKQTCFVCEWGLKRVKQASREESEYRVKLEMTFKTYYGIGFFFVTNGDWLNKFWSTVGCFNPFNFGLYLLFASPALLS